MSALRRATQTLRYRRLGPSIGGPDATLRGQWIPLAVSAAVVFACFFAIGRVVRAGGSSGGGTPAALEGGAPHAAVVPDRMSGDSPIAGAVPVTIVAKPRPRARQATRKPLPTVAPSATVASDSTAPVAPARIESSASAPATVGSPVQPAPSGSAVRGRSSPGVGGAGGQGTSGGTGSSGHGSSGAGRPSSGEPPTGGSFDSSE